MKEVHEMHLFPYDKFIELALLGIAFRCLRLAHSNSRQGRSCDTYHDRFASSSLLPPVGFSQADLTL